MTKKSFLIAFLLVSLTSYCNAQGFQKMKIDHVAVYVVNLQQSGKFYMDILGLDTMPELFHDKRHFWFSLGAGISLHMIQGAEKSKEYFQNDHLCLRTDNVVAFTKHLEANKVVWFDVKGNPNKITSRVDGVQQVWVKDPDGYWIEVNNAK